MTWGLVNFWKKKETILPGKKLSESQERAKRGNLPGLNGSDLESFFLLKPQQTIPVRVTEDTHWVLIITVILEWGS